MAEGLNDDIVMASIKVLANQPKEVSIQCLETHCALDPNKLVHNPYVYFTVRSTVMFISHYVFVFVKLL